MTLDQHIAAIDKHLASGVSGDAVAKLSSLAGRIRVSQRTVSRGAARVEHVCPKCGDSVSGTREFRKHRCLK